MIRRKPTAIPLSDLDVQDLKDFLSKQKATAEAARSAEESRRNLTLAAVATQDPARAREIREERLGIKQ